MLVLTDEGKELLEDYRQLKERHGDVDCICLAVKPPCPMCEHPGNERCIEENSSLWLFDGGPALVKQREKAAFEQWFDRRNYRLFLTMSTLLFVCSFLTGGGVFVLFVLGVLSAALGDMVSTYIYPDIEQLGYCESYQPCTPSWLKPWEL